MRTDDSSRISPTAHYTSYVWVRNQLSHPALASPFGRRLYRALWPVMEAYAALSGHPNLEGMLLTRHRRIDELLAAAIESGEVGQVIEIAAGFSGRGWRFMQRYGGRGVTYTDGDLPAQAAEKRRILDDAGLRGAGYEVVALDALIDEGPQSLAAIARARPGVGCAVITEGLLGYLDREAVTRLWARIASVLAGSPGGVYLSDLNLAADVRGLAHAFRRALEVFTRGRVHLHFRDPGEAEAALRAAGFSSVTIHRPGALVRVIEARPRPA